MVKLNIDDTAVVVSKGISILEAARSVGVDIPNFCYDKELTVTGSCRICVVEVEGQSNLISSCSTEAVDGMVIKTESPKVVEARKMILDLMWANHPMDCLTCSKVGQCKLQEYSCRYDVKGTSFVGERKNHQIDDTNPVILRDQNKCILCGKCVNVCKEVQVSSVVEFVGRGFETKVTTAFDQDLSEKNCRLCGQCVEVCPTGALINKQFNKVRPWEVKKVRTTCPFCGTGCNFDLNVKNGKVMGVTPAADAVVNGRELCVKGRFHTDLIHSPNRLTTPLIRKNGELVEASWDEALGFIAEKLLETKEKYGSDGISGLSSARCVNEDNYVFQKMMRAALGTNNVDHCARTCHAPTVAGLARTFGSGAMTNSIGEVEFNDVLFIIGCNATEAHPIIGNKMKRAKKRGAKLIVIDPRRTELAEMADYWLPLNNGSDVALVNGIMNIIISNGWHKKDYIDSRCVNFDEMWDVVKKYKPDLVSEITGVSEELMYKAADLYANTEKAGIFYTLGITEHTSGTDNVMSLANLAMITGHVGKEFSGVNPLRGQNNVQGSCDMAALPNNLPGYKDIENPENIAFFESKWGVKLNNKNGYRIPEMFEAMLAGNLKAMYVMGEDPVLTDSDANHVKKAFRCLDLLVVQDLYMTETAKFAHVVLPGSCYAEKDGTFTNTERRVQRVRKAVNAPGQSRLDWEILCDVSRRLGYEMNYSSAEDIFNEVRSVIPAFAGITYERIDKEGIHWPCPTVEHPGTPVLHRDTFSHGKGRLMAIEYRDPAEVADSEYPVVMSTGRMLYHYNVMTRNSASLDAIRPCELAEINPREAASLGVGEGDFIKVLSRRGSIKTKVTITDKVKPGTIFMTLHYKESPVNELTNSAYDPISKTPEYKVTAVRLEKA